LELLALHQIHPKYIWTSRSTQGFEQPLSKYGAELTLHKSHKFCNGRHLAWSGVCWAMAMEFILLYVPIEKLINKHTLRNIQHGKTFDN